jgi:hypothetical protein
MQVEYVPSGLFMWHPSFDTQAEAGRASVRIVADKTREQALAAAKQVYSNARPDDIRRTYGVLAATFTMPDGTQQSMGRPIHSWRINQ